MQKVAEILSFAKALSRSRWWPERLAIFFEPWERISIPAIGHTVVTPLASDNQVCCKGILAGPPVIRCRKVYQKRLTLRAQLKRELNIAASSKKRSHRSMKFNYTCLSFGQDSYMHFMIDSKQIPGSKELPKMKSSVLQQQPVALGAIDRERCSGDRVHAHDSAFVLGCHRSQDLGVVLKPSPTSSCLLGCSK